MPHLLDQLRSNLDAVRGQIRAAADRAGRNPADITLVAVTKYAPDEAIQALASLGVLDLGEARPQQLEARQQLAPQACWHLIGHLQRNKVRPVVSAASLIHSVDSLKLLERIGQIAGELGRHAEVLLEVNVSGESAKDGFDPGSLRSKWSQCLAVPNVVIRGLMTMAPLDSDPESARPVFRALRELRDELRTPSVPLPDLSMGMSGDFEVAIEEGATLIRIGSALFEGIE
jgi:pyridoxal phosphate enzyme (YggS family)